MLYDTPFNLKSYAHAQFNEPCVTASYLHTNSKINSKHVDNNNQASYIFHIMFEDALLFDLKHRDHLVYREDVAYEGKQVCYI